MKIRMLCLVLVCGSSYLAARAEEHPVMKIMALGDSITAGYHTGKGGYRNYLRDILIKDGRQVDFVGRSTDRSDGIPDPEHEGYSGATIALIAEKADGALQTFEPDVILLFAGSNDIRVNGDNGNPKNPIYFGTASERMEALLATIWQRRPKAMVIVGTLMPFAGGWAVRENAAKEFNAKLVNLVDKYHAKGKSIALVDFRKTITGEDLSDGLHPNSAGYEKMATAWAKTMRVAIGP